MFAGLHNQSPPLTMFRIKLNWQVVLAWLVCDIYNLRALFDILQVQLCHLGNKETVRRWRSWCFAFFPRISKQLSLRWCVYQTKKKKSNSDLRSSRDRCAVVQSYWAHKIFSFHFLLKDLKGTRFLHKILRNNALVNECAIWYQISSKEWNVKCNRVARKT